ncbi:MAG: hypothetical protein QM504_17105 [Pseudomonadota bacterium]
MLAIIPIIILAGGLSVGAFDNTFEESDMNFADNVEMNMSATQIASLEPFPLD